MYTVHTTHIIPAVPAAAVPIEFSRPKIYQYELNYTTMLIYNFLIVECVFINL